MLSGYLCCIIYFIYRWIRRGGGCPGCCQRVFGNDKNWSPRLFKSEEGQTPDSPFTYFNASLQMYLSIITIDNRNVYSILSCNAILHIWKRQFLKACARTNFYIFLLWYFCNLYKGNLNYFVTNWLELSNTVILLASSLILIT